jgi:hypothetical protein
MAPDTPEWFLSAASAFVTRLYRVTRQDQTRFGGSVADSFRSQRLREFPPAPEKLLRAVGRRFKRQGSKPQFVQARQTGAAGNPRARPSLFVVDRAEGLIQACRGHVRNV